MEGREFPGGWAGLRIQHCHCCGSGCCCGAGSIPDRGISTCWGRGQKNKKKKHYMEAGQGGWVGQGRGKLYFPLLHFIWLVLYFTKLTGWIRTFCALSAPAVQWNKNGKWIIHVHNTLGGASSCLLFDVLRLKLPVAKGYEKEQTSSQLTFFSLISPSFPPKSFFHT